MLKEILIQVTKEETKVGVLEKRRLVEVYLERSFQMRLAGNIYKGRIENVLPGMQAAFVNIGLERNAFLYVEDVHTTPGRRENLPIQSMLREGEEILVQVVKEPFGTKGARVTTQLTLPGRYVVLLPDLACIGVSRRITQERERERLKNLAEEVRIPGSGLIVRTVAEGVSRDELAEDVATLYDLWKRTKEKSAKYSAPAMLYQDLELVSWVLRDLVGEEIDRLVVNDPETYERILELLGSDAHSFGRKVQLVESDLWEDYGIDQEVTRALRPKVWLRSGGYLVIDETEALTVIDVNTGKYTGSKNFADTVFRTNLEAIPEIVRQVRLRNLGGIIIVDFIDMEVLEHRAEVLRRLDEESEAGQDQNLCPRFDPPRPGGDDAQKGAPQPEQPAGKVVSLLRGQGPGAVGRDCGPENLSGSPGVRQNECCPGSPGGSQPRRGCLPHRRWGQPPPVPGGGDREADHREGKRGRPPGGCADAPSVQPGGDRQPGGPGASRARS